MDCLGWGVRWDALVWDGLLRRSSTQQGGWSHLHRVRGGGKDSGDNGRGAKIEQELPLGEC
jgi:hypothetical protein